MLLAICFPGVEPHIVDVIIAEQNATTDRNFTTRRETCLGIDGGERASCTVCFFTNSGMYVPFDPMVGPGW